MAKIYRGGYQNNHPEVVERKIATAAAGILPGTIVKISGGEFVAAVTADLEAQEELFVLNHPPTFDVDYAYSAGETGYGYIPISGQVYAVRAAAGVIGDQGVKLAVGTAGSAILQTTETEILGHIATAVPAATTAGQLIDLRIA